MEQLQDITAASELKHFAIAQKSYMGASVLLYYIGWQKGINLHWRSVQKWFSIPVLWDLLTVQLCLLAALPHLIELVKGLIISWWVESGAGNNAARYLLQESPSTGLESHFYTVIIGIKRHVPLQTLIYVYIRNILWPMLYMPPMFSEVTLGFC